MNKVYDSPIRFAVIGCGHIGKRHATMILENQETELAALCDIRAKEELDISNFQVPFYPNLGSLLKNELEVDVVCVCTPNGLHASQCIQILDSGAHVVVEKPMALTKSDCEAVIFKALNVSRRVFCVMQNRYSPPAKWIKGVLEKDLLGKIHLVQINSYWNRDDRYYLKEGQRHSWHGDKKLDGGTLYTQFSHFIDIMFWLFGDIKEVRGQFSDFSHSHSTDFEDSGMIQFRFQKGGMGCMNYTTTTWDKNFESSMTIIGSKGTVKIGGQYMNKVEYCHIQDYEMPELPPGNPPNDYGAYKGSAANHHFVIENVVDVLKRRRSITTNAIEGMKVVEIIEKIYKTNFVNKLLTNQLSHSES